MSDNQGSMMGGLQDWFSGLFSKGNQVDVSGFGAGGMLGTSGYGLDGQGNVDVMGGLSAGALSGPQQGTAAFDNLNNPQQAGALSGFMNDDGSFNMETGLQAFQALSASLQGLGAYNDSKSNAALNKHMIGKDRLETDNNVALAQTRLNDQSNKMSHQRPDLYGNRATTQLQSFGNGTAANTSNTLGNYGNPNPNTGGNNTNDRNRRLGG